MCRAGRAGGGGGWELWRLWNVIAGERGDGRGWRTSPVASLHLEGADSCDVQPGGSPECGGRVS